MATRLSTFAALLLCACTHGAPADDAAGRAAAAAPVLDPFPDPADGKTDGGATFFAATTPHAFALNDTTLSLGGRVDYPGVKRSAGPDGELSLRLRKGDRVAGMSTLRFLPAGPAALARIGESRLFAALGVVAPRVVTATLRVDGGPPEPYLLVEAVDARFLTRRFDTDAGTTYAPGELPEVLAPALAAPGRRSFGAVLDVEATLGFFAARAALDSPVGLSLYDACEAGAPCLEPLAGERVESPEADALSRALRSVPALHARYVERLDEAVTCLETPACLREPLKRQAAALGLAPAMATKVAQGLETRAEALRAWLDALPGADLPDGGTDYRTFTTDDDGALTAWFRFTPVDAAPATGVTLRLGDDALPMSFHAAANLWSVALGGGPGSRVGYDFEVTDVAGRRSVVADPTGGGRLDARRIDELVAVDDFGLDFPEASGLAWHGESLYAVSDAKPAIYRVDPENGDRLARIAVDATDLEAVAVDPLTGEFLIAPESKGEIRRLAVDGGEVSTNGVRWADDGNSGLEGLTVRAEDGHVFAAKEKGPSEIAEYGDDGRRLRRVSVDFAHDLSELTLADDGWFYALSDEDETLFRLDADFDAVRSWALPMKHPEGLAVHGGRVYIANDGEDRLFVFELRDGRAR